MMMNKRCKTILPYLRWANIKTWMEYPHFVTNKNKFLKIEFFFFFTMHTIKECICTYFYAMEPPVQFYNI